MSHYNIAHAKAELSALVQKALLGEEVIIAKGNKPLAKLVPLRAPKEAKRTPGKGKSEVLFIAADFDKPLEDFKDYS